MKFRTTFRGKLFLLTIVPLAVAQLVTLIAVMDTVRKDVDGRARESLQIGGNVVSEYLASRSDQLKISVEVLAADFGLKEVAATGDTETIRSVLRNHSLRVGADIALLLDLDGHAIASTEPVGDVDLVYVVEQADAESAASSLHFAELIGGTAYQAFAVPLRAPTTIAWVVVGFRIDQSVVQRIATLTGLDVAIITDEVSPSLIAASGIPSPARLDPRLLVSDSRRGGSVYMLPGQDTDYIALQTAFASGSPGIKVILLRSLKTAMAPYVEARKGLVLFAFLLLAAVAGGAMWVSGGIAKPLRTLTSAARHMISGHYDVSVRVATDDEFGELASSFNSMRTAIAEREQRISHQALHDSLTDLPNRSKMVRELTVAIEKADPGKTIAVVAIRLSRMSEISSTLGHSASDELIRLAAKYLRVNLDASDLIAHVGTNEFMVMLPGRDINEAQACAESIENILSAGVAMGRVNITLRTESGIAVYPDHGSSAADLMRNATIARSEAQARGESVVVYETGRDEFYVRQLRIVNDLRSAIQNDELLVNFQPKISLPNGRISGAEALVRWKHREYGWLSPDEFVPAAEEAGTIVHLTRHVLSRAIRECRSWKEAGHELQVSVNISARDLQDEYLPYYILQLLKEHDMAPQRLTLEVTENTVMQKVQHSISVLECLRDIGVRISMDDFGTGQSSMAQLRKIPLHELKIDKSFVMTMLADKQNEAIVRTTLDLAHHMNLEVVAEGVEDENTLRCLSDAGCEQAQGYFVSKALPSIEFLAWLQSREPVSYEERRGAKRVFRREA